MLNILSGHAFGVLDPRGDLSDLILRLLHRALLQSEKGFTSSFSRVWFQSNFNKSVPEALCGNKHAIVWICGQILELRLIDVQLFALAVKDSRDSVHKFMFGLLALEGFMLLEYRIFGDCFKESLNEHVKLFVMFQ